MNGIEIEPKESSISSEHCRDFFNQKWQLYQKVLGNNYMGHQEMYHYLQQFLASNFKQPFQIMDLGCGDSSFMATALLNTSVASYLGIDLSEVALEIASKNMNGVARQTRFMQGDFKEILPAFLNESADRFDVIASSFAIHHLTLEQKSQIFERIHRLLLPGGVFLLIDIVSKPAETRETYIQRYLDGVEQTWLQLTPAETKIVSEHMLGSDFPETEETLSSLAAQNGFRQQQCLYENSSETARLIVFYA